MLWVFRLWKAQNGRLLLDDSGWSRPRFVHGYYLALHVLGLGLLLLQVDSRELEEGKAPLLSSCALGRQVEQLQSRA